MELQIIRSKVDSPDWLNQLSKKYRRDHAEKLQKADQKRKREKLEFVNEIVAKIGKQDPKVETTEIEKPSPTLQDNKVDAKAILDVIKEISETLETHAGIIEDLSDRVERLEQRQPSQGAAKRQGDFALRGQASEADLEAIQARFEEIGLTGEVVKEIRNPFIGGRFLG